jgi:hypothetical protein
MNDFVEFLKTRMEEAQRRLQAAALKLQAAQLEHQSAAQESNGWVSSYQSELRKQQAASGATPAVPQVTAHPLTPDKPEINQTEVVRQVIQQHPAGVTPIDVWKAVNSQIKHRPYVYSVLKRLSDKGDVFKRRGKYFPKVTSKSEEGRAGQAIVQ